jgi:hypothetical protein
MKNNILIIGTLALILSLNTIPAKAQYIEPLKIDLFEQTGIKLDWNGLVNESQPIPGRIVDIEKLFQSGIKEELMDDIISISVTTGDKWKIQLNIDTLVYYLIYRPGKWEIFHEFELISNEVLLEFIDICDFTPYLEVYDDYLFYDMISTTDYFDSKMVMFGTAWTGLKDEFKYNHLKEIQTGDEVTIYNVEKYKWMFRFPENGLEMLVVYTPGIISSIRD